MYNQIIKCFQFLVDLQEKKTVVESLLILTLHAFLTLNVGVTMVSQWYLKETQHIQYDIHSNG